MAEDATGVRSRNRLIVAWVAIGAVLVGVFSTWTEVGPATLNGTEGPNNGWLVVILAVPTIFWARMMEQRSWSGAIGAIGVLGASLVMCLTAVENWVDNRDVLDASAGHGLLLVVAASLVLLVVAGIRGVELVRSELRRRDA